MSDHSITITEKKCIDTIYALQREEKQVLTIGQQIGKPQYSNLIRIAQEQETEHKLRKQSIRLENDPEYARLSEKEQNKYLSISDADIGATKSNERVKSYLTMWEHSIR